MTEDLREVVQRLEAEALADRMEAMQRLTAGLAHALRNAVNGARLQLALLERRLPRDVRVDKSTAAVRDELAGLTELLDEFLLFARPSPLATQNEEVVALVGEAIAEERPLAATRGTELRFAANVEHALFALDGSKLAFVVGELVHNAIEAGLPGGHVDVGLEVGPDRLRLFVCDDGPGIPPAVHERIYEPFYTTRERGRGMGLAIVHAFVVQHRGAIELTSHGRETRFVVTIPRA